MDNGAWRATVHGSIYYHFGTSLFPIAVLILGSPHMKGQSSVSTDGDSGLLYLLTHALISLTVNPFLGLSLDLFLFS